MHKRDWSLGLINLHCAICLNLHVLFSKCVVLKNTALGCFLMPGVSQIKPWFYRKWFKTLKAQQRSGSWALGEGHTCSKRLRDANHQYVPHSVYPGEYTGVVLHWCVTAWVELCDSLGPCLVQHLIHFNSGALFLPLSVFVTYWPLWCVLCVPFCLPVSI